MAFLPILARYNILKGLSASALIAVLLFPRPVLAFEAGLSHSPARKLTAQVHLTGGYYLPNYSYRASGTVTAFPSVQTTSANWQRSTQLVYSAPILTLPLVMEGEASYYSRVGCLGCGATLTMANGQPLDDNALTMAIGADKKQLVGHRATITNTATGQSVNVLITDTGGFYQTHYGSRVADLTIATKQAIGMAGGVGQVRVIVH